MNKKEKEAEERDYYDVSDFIKIEMVREARANGLDFDSFEAYIYGQMVNYILADEIIWRADTRSHLPLEEQVIEIKNKVVNMAQSYLRADDNFRKLIVLHLKRKTLIIRSSFKDDNALFKSPQWQRINEVISSQQTDYSIDWDWNEYMRLLRIYAKKRGQEQLIK